MFRTLLSAACLAGLAASAAGAQTAAYRQRILGVFDAQSGEPLEGVEVSDLLTNTSALTTKTGTVTLAFLPEGGTLVRIRKIGYTSTTMMVAISPADTVPITVLLATTAQTLPTVVTNDSAPRYVSARLRQFEERRSRGVGHFITEDELRKNDSHLLRDVVRRLPGLQIKCISKGVKRGECYATSFRQQSARVSLGGECPVKVYIDGASIGDNDLSKLDVNHFAGIEYYSGGSTIPPQYNTTDSSCGVMLLWTRER
jgi:hypothetical protein